MIEEVKKIKVTCDRCGKSITVDSEEEATKQGFTTLILEKLKKEYHTCDECNHKLENLAFSFIMTNDDVLLMSKKGYDENMDAYFNQGYREGHREAIEECGCNLYEKLNEFGVNIAFGEEYKEEYIEVNVPAHGIDISYPNGFGDTKRITIYRQSRMNKNG